MVALFVALMFIGFLLTDAIAQRVGRKAPANVESVWDIPQGFYLFEGHSWSRPDSSVGVRVGVDALVACALGVVEKVILPEPGQVVEAGQPLFRLERSGCGLNVRSSVTGRVVALNTRLGKRPDAVAKDPYGSGWICAITPTQSDNSLPGMRFGQKAADWLEQEFYRFREFLSMQVSPDMAVAITYPDGGLPANGSLAELPLRGWGAFEATFLDPSPGATRESVRERE
jgi:glycine cleavage system H protein